MISSDSPRRHRQYGAAGRIFGPSEREKRKKGLTKNVVPPPTFGRRRARKWEFSVLRDICYDLSETHMVLFLSYL